MDGLNYKHCLLYIVNIKAKKYQTLHNTDYSIIVTEKGITKKDSHTTRFGMRESIFLVHPTAVVEIANLIRRFIIESAKQTSSNKGRTSKQARLYDYLKSPEYARTIQTIRDMNSKMDDLQRKEEDYHKDTWAKRKKLIEESRKISELNQQKTVAIKNSLVYFILYTSSYKYSREFYY